MMKALSIRQPWTWTIVEGYKPVENRDWQPRNPGLKFRGPVLIHASMTPDRDAFSPEILKWIEDRLPAGVKVPPRDELQYGGIVGAAEIVDIVRQHPSPFFTGPFGLVLANVRAVPFMPCKGKLGFFEVKYDLK